ncbi:DUF4405 domain-containing protein [Phyllobacterium sp. LjRoot231]|uniref:DUF4405 domain-containing protein n=1 Tax=Phyllobacterium sp. LjRoot231 TaxID=3342289 RepID=UPI003ECC34F0
MMVFIVNPVFLLRLALDFGAVGLFMGAMAYWWLDNRTHELVGTTMFALLFLHNVFNRRWYGGLPKTRREPRPLATVFLNLGLLVTIVTLLTTSILISQSLFLSLAVGGATARDVHILAAYWAMIIISIHLGMHWSIVMNVIWGLSGRGKPNLAVTILLRTAAFAAAASGVYNSFELDIGSRLLLIPTMQFWDFNEDTLGFFLHHGSVVALYVCLGHYAMVLQQASRRPRDRALRCITDVAGSPEP